MLFSVCGKMHVKFKKTLLKHGPECRNALLLLDVFLERVLKFMSSSCKRHDLDNKQNNRELDP